MKNATLMNAIASFTLLGLIAGASTLVGCDRRAVEEKTVDNGVETVPEASSTPPTSTTPTTPPPSTPSEQPSQPAQPQQQPTPAEASAQPWTVPTGWTQDTKPRPMRLATYNATHAEGTAEVAITRFGGRVGGELANINRWRGQMGLKPITDSELDTAITRFSSPGYDGYETRIESPTGVMLAAGVYEAAIDQTWFVRATLPNTAAADHLQADLFAMARSIMKR